MLAWDPYREYKRSDQGKNKINNICTNFKRLGRVQKALKKLQQNTYNR